jgi:hypothetical protein
MPFLYFSRNFLCLSPYRLVKSIILDRRPLGHGQRFRFGDNVLENLHELTTPVVAAHCRVGDYPDLGYVVVSRRSYYDACRTFAISYDWLQFCIGLSTPCPSPGLSVMPTRFNNASITGMGPRRTASINRAGRSSSEPSSIPCRSRAADLRERPVSFSEKPDHERYDMRAIYWLLLGTLIVIAGVFALILLP